MKNSTHFLFAVAFVASLFAAAALRPVTAEIKTSADVQQAINDHYDHYGPGVIRLDPKRYDWATPIIVPSEISVDCSWSDIHYSGTGALFRFGIRQAGGTPDHEGGSVVNARITAPLGSAFGPADGVQTISHIRIQNMKLDTKDDSIRFVQPQFATGVVLSNITMKGSTDRMLVNLKVNEVDIDEVHGGRMTIEGQGVIANSSTHGTDPAKPGLTLIGSAFEIIGDWSENRGGFLFDGAKVQCLSTMAWTAKPDMPVRLRNKAELVTLKLSYQDVGGMQPQRSQFYKMVNGIKVLDETKYLAAVKSLKAQCYVVDDASVVQESGVIVVGK